LAQGWLGEQNLKGYGLGNHGRPWACEREGPVLKKMLWEMGTCSRLSERLIGDGRDSAKRVVSGTIPLQVFLKILPKCNTGGGERRGWEAGECGTRAPHEGM